MANFEKKVPREWINEAGNGVTHDFIDYVLPLIQGESDTPKENGLPRFAHLKKILTTACHKIIFKAGVFLCPGFYPQEFFKFPPFQGGNFLFLLIVFRDHFTQVSHRTGSGLNIPLLQ